MTFFLSWEQIFWNRIFYVVRYENPIIILEIVVLYHIYHMQKTEWKNLFSNKSYSLWTFGRFALQMRLFFEKFLPSPMTFDWDEVFCFCFFYLNLVTLLFVQTKYKQNFKPEMEKKRPLKNFVQRNQMCWNWAYLVVNKTSLSKKIFHIKLDTPEDPNLKISAKNLIGIGN